MIVVVALLVFLNYVIMLVLYLQAKRHLKQSRANEASLLETCATWQSSFNTVSDANTSLLATIERYKAMLAPYITEPTIVIKETTP